MEKYQSIALNSFLEKEKENCSISNFLNCFFAFGKINKELTSNNLSLATPLLSKRTMFTCPIWFLLIIST